MMMKDSDKPEASLSGRYCGQGEDAVSDLKAKAGACTEERFLCLSVKRI